MASDGARNIHATALSLAGKGILIRGRSGSGKSDLALRVIGMPPGPFLPEPALLVADDRVLATPSREGVRLTCPAPLQGLIEVRGIGIVRVPCASEAILALVVDLAEPHLIERLPPPGDTAEICDRRVARVQLAPFEPSTPLKLLLALAALNG